MQEYNSVQELYNALIPAFNVKLRMLKNSEYKNISPVIYNYNYELHIYKNKYNGYYSFGIKPTEQIEQEEIRRLKRYGEYRPWLGILFQYNKEISKYDFYYYKAADI